MDDECYLGKVLKGGAHLIIVRGLAILFGTFADFELHIFVFDGKSDIEMRNFGSCFLLS